MASTECHLASFPCRNPVLLFTEPSKVKGRLKSLDALFPPTDLKSLLRNNPNLLTDGWEDIMAKIMYIHKVKFSVLYGLGILGNVPLHHLFPSDH